MPHRAHGIAADDLFQPLDQPVHGRRLVRPVDRLPAGVTGGVIEGQRTVGHANPLHLARQESLRRIPGRIHGELDARRAAIERQHSRTVGPCGGLIGARGHIGL